MEDSDDTDHLEEIKKSVQERIDAAIERIQSFLDKKHTYAASLEPDPFKTGKIWFLKLKRDTSCIVLASITESNKISAEHICKRITMMLLVMGFNIRSNNGGDLDFSNYEFQKMKDWQSFFEENDIRIHYSSIENKEFTIHFSGKKKSIDFITIGGITQKGVSVLCKQIAIILGGLGKNFSTSDNTVGNRYGIVEICP